MSVLRRRSVRISPGYARTLAMLLFSPAPLTFHPETWPLVGILRLGLARSWFSFFRVARDWMNGRWMSPLTSVRLFPPPKTPTDPSNSPYLISLGKKNHIIRKRHDKADHRFPELCGTTNVFFFCDPCVVILCITR